MVGPLQTQDAALVCCERGTYLLYKGAFLRKIDGYSCRMLN